MATLSTCVGLTIRRGREDKGLAAIDANIAQVVQQWVVGGAAVAQRYQLLQTEATQLPTGQMGMAGGHTSLPSTPDASSQLDSVALFGQE